MRCAILLLLALCIAPLPVDAGPLDYPRLVVGQDNEQCRDVLAMAEAVFASDAFYLYDPTPIPEEFKVRMALMPKALGISGGRMLRYDENLFERIPDPQDSHPQPEYAYQRLIWQREAQHGWRFVLEAHFLGWRGDLFDLYAAPAALTPQGVFESLRDHSFKSLFQGWRPPYVFLSPQGGVGLAVDVGNSFEVLREWKTYELTPDGARLACEVRFLPAESTPLTPLPNPARKLAMLLYNTLGMGHNVSIDRWRGDALGAKRTWGNLAMRPWAVPDRAHNRELVDIGLQRWSRQAASFKRQYQKILAAYPKAETALAEYYRNQFNMPENEAKTMAARNLNSAYCSYYSFPQSLLYEEKK